MSNNITGKGHRFTTGHPCHYVEWNGLQNPQRFGITVFGSVLYTLLLFFFLNV